jgi:hypothetical protein
LRVGFPRGVDIVLNCIEASTNFDQLPAMLAPGGTAVLITGMTEKQNVGLYMPKRLRIVYEFMFSRILHDWEPEKQARPLSTDPDAH